MSYEPTNWKKGDKVTSARLNKIEQGIQGIDNDTSTIKEDLNAVSDDVDEYLLSKYTTVKPNDWFNPSGATSGVIYKNGTTDKTANRQYTDYIPVTNGDVVKVIMPSNLNTLYLLNVCCYDADKNVLASVGSDSSSSSFTVPSGVAYIRITISTSFTNNPWITINYTPTSASDRVPYFEPYKVLTEDFLTEESEAVIEQLRGNGYKRPQLANRYACCAPKQGIKMTIELQQPWYIESIISQPFLTLDLKTAGLHRRYDNRIEFVCTTAREGLNGYLYKVYDEVFGAILYSDTDYVASGYGLPVKWANENLSDCSLLAIGDSTVDQDTMTAKILEEFTAQGQTITLLGTLGSGQNKNEGRAGWKATDYLTNRQYEGVVNPFYNPTSETFDFAYYMTNQGYSAPDFVVIQLGINDLYNLTFDAVPSTIVTTWDAIKAMIDSILSYDNSIKIILNLPTTPKNDISVHTAFLPLYRNSRMMYNHYAQEQARLYSTDSVRVSYCHLILDADSDINDTVHPNVSGYTKMAKEVVSQINCWQNG